MLVIIWLFWLSFVYFILVFVLSRFVIPHLGNGVDLLPEKIPVEMEKAIDELKARAKTKEEFLNVAYQFLGKKNRSGRLNTIVKFNYLFKSLADIWRIDGYIPCTQSNYLLRIFLCRSGFFQNDEIRKKYSFLNFVLHQYLEVKINGQWLAVEVGEASRGLPIGQRQKLFAM